MTSDMRIPPYFRAGPLCMVGACLGFTVMVTCAKSLSEELTGVEVVFWRSFFSVPATFLLARRTRWRMHSRGLILIRSVCGFGSVACLFTAAMGLPVATVQFINKLQPVWMVLVAPLLLGRGERGGRETWLALLLSLVGCTLMLAPSGDARSSYGAWALTGTLFATAAHLAVRKLNRTEAPQSIVFWFQSIAMVCALILILASPAHQLNPPTSLTSWILLCGCGLATAVAQTLMTWAYRFDRAPVVAAASYSELLWGLLADLIIFATFPSLVTLGGGALVLAAGALLVFQRADRSSPRRSPGPSS